MNGFAQVSEMTHTIGRYSLRAVGALLVLIVAWKMAGLARQAVKNGLDRAQADPTLTRFGGNVAYWLIIGVAMLAALGTIGIETTNVATVLGGASVAIGLAFKDSLGNFAAGILLMLFRPFRAGDTITVAGVTGRVYDIELFVTRLDTFDNRRLMLPNGAVFRANIENATHHPARRIDLTIYVGPTADLDQVRRLLLEAAKTQDCRGYPAQEVVLNAVGAKVEWLVHVWCATDDYMTVRERVLTEIKLRLDRAEIPML